jgi:hypothetical protein
MWIFAYLGLYLFCEKPRKRMMKLKIHNLLLISK